MNTVKFEIENGIMKGEEKIFETGNADLGKWFLETLKSRPDFLGQIDPITGEESTYGKMADESVRCALWMRKQGLKPGDNVFICTHNKISTYVPVLATFYNRANLIFGYKGIPLQLARYFFKLLEPKFIFTEERELELFSEAAKEEGLAPKIVVFNKLAGFESLNEILSQAEQTEVDDFRCSEPTNPNENCILALTSGTTGDSKIVWHSYKSIMEALLICTSNKKQDGIVSILYLPIEWLCALRVMLTDILIFAKRIIVSETSYDLNEAFNFIEKYKVTHVRFSLNMMYRMYKCRELFKYDTSSLRAITFNGMKLRPEILKFMMQVAKNGKLEQTYGATEMSIPMVGGTMNTIDLNSCGYLFPNISMKVIDVQTGEILGVRGKGEICFKSPYLMRSYYKNQQATEKAIDSEGWYHTGDLGYYEDTGLVYVLGRVKNTLMVQSGKLLPLWEIVRSLELNSEVTQVMTISDLEVSGQSQIVAFVTLIPGSKVTEEDLRELVKNLTTITVPITVKILDILPQTSNGKVQLNELKKIAENILRSYH